MTEDYNESATRVVSTAVSYNISHTSARAQAHSDLQSQLCTDISRQIFFFVAVLDFFATEVVPSVKLTFPTVQSPASLSHSLYLSVFLFVTVPTRLNKAS